MWRLAGPAGISILQDGQAVPQATTQVTVNFKKTEVCSLVDIVLQHSDVWENPDVWKLNDM